MDFYPGQRWESEGEPELGVGVIIEAKFGRVQVAFPSSGENRMYAEGSAPLRRVRFQPGDTVADQDQRPFLIERVQENEELILYIGQQGVLSEADLGEVKAQHGVDSRLLSGLADSPALFALRRQTLMHQHARSLSPIHGFVGGRIDLIPHQLYIAHEVSSRHAPRVLLSDQVGLGKTIEACLILHRLLLSGRASRVLILVPDSLVHQWFVELLRRFNLWFHIFDEERCEALDATAPEGNPFLDDQLVLCSTSFLAGSPQRARQAIAANWDMLVVDEAHHLAWSPEQASTEYTVVELLSQVAKGLLLLTATPEQLGVASHFARLRLLDPERYADYDAFLQEPHDHTEVARVVESLMSGQALTAQEKAVIADRLGKERLAAYEQGIAVTTEQLVEDLLDQHGPGRVVFRNTRAAMSGFPTRQAQLIPLSAEGPWLDSLKEEFAQDQDPATDHAFHLSQDPRVSWLVKHLAALAPAKVLLICRSKAKVLALEKALEQRSPAKVGVFHEDLSLVQRDRNAAWFAEAEGAQILLCSEIGSEGRNFQFAHHLVLFDLPLHPEMLEQRIERLDRIGQTQDIQIHVPYGQGSPQEVLVRWYHEGLRAFEANVEGGNAIGQRFLSRVAELAAKADTGPALETLIADTAEYQGALKQKLAQGRDRLLEMNSFRPQVAEQLIAAIQAADQDRALETYLTQVFEHAGIEMEDLAPRTYRVHPSRANQTAFPSIPDEGISITFDRVRALSREDISFISWDHPMATGALDMILSTDAGTTSFGRLKSIHGSGLLLEAIFVLETRGGQGVDVNRFLPHTPIRVVVTHTGEDVTEDYTPELLSKRLIPGKVEPLLDNETVADLLLPNMLTTATNVATQIKGQQVGRSLQQMAQTLDHEIGRLATLHQRNPSVRPDEIHTAITEKAALTELIEGATLRLDALLLIQEGEVD